MTTQSETIWERTLRAQGSPARALPAAPEADKLDAPLVAYEVLDEARVRTALRGEHLPPRGLLRLWTELTAPVDVLDGALRLEPTDRGQPGASDLSLALYEVIVDAIGIEPIDEASDEFIPEGQAVMRAMLLELPTTKLERFIGADESRLRAAESAGRQYLLPAAAIEAVTGRPSVSRRGLLTPGPRAHALREAKRERAELEAQAQAAAEAARIEADRPRSLRERGYQCISCRKNRLTGVPEPFPHGAPQAETETHFLYLLRELPGLRLPPFDQDGVALLDGDSPAPTLHGPVQDPPLVVVAWIRAMRRRFSKSLDFGAVREFSDVGTDRARALAREHARVFVDPPVSRLWFQDHLLALIVRGLGVHPTAATFIVVEELDRIHVARHAPVAIPTQLHWRETALEHSAHADLRAAARPESGRRMVDPAGAADLPSRGRARVMVGDLAVAAAEAGDVGVGELLEQDLPAPPAMTTTRAKKGSR